MVLKSTEEPKEVKKKERVQIVGKLPVQEVRRIETETEIINLMTVEEYLTKMANEEEE